MTQPTPDAAATGRAGRRGAFLAAAAVCVVHALVLLALAAFYGVELARGEGRSAAAVTMSGVLILVFAALLALLARVWWVGSTRAAVPTIVWNGLLVPVVTALYGAEDGLLATGLLVLVVAGIGTAAAALRTRTAADAGRSGR